MRDGKGFGGVWDSNLSFAYPYLLYIPSFDQ